MRVVSAYFLSRNTGISNSFFRNGFHNDRIRADRYIISNGNIANYLCSSANKYIVTDLGCLLTSVGGTDIYPLLQSAVFTDFCRIADYNGSVMRD